MYYPLIKNKLKPWIDIMLDKPMDIQEFTKCNLKIKAFDEDKHIFFSKLISDFDRKISLM